MFQMLTDPLRRTVLAGLVVSAIGIPIQILGGWDYPVVPPGMLILLAAGLSALLPTRWAPAISLVAGGFVLVGFFVVGDVANMLGSQNALVTAGKWLQLLALVVGLVAAVGSLVRPPARRVATR
jgi:di/tricarboxylate transporter